MGKRFIKSRLVSPLCRIDDINEIYDYVDEFLKKDKWNKFTQYLSNIRDIERLERKLSLGTIQPYDMFSYIESLSNCHLLLKKISKEKKITCIEDNNMYKTVHKIVKKCNKTFNYETLKMTNFSKDVGSSIFVKGYNKKIDELEAEMESGNEFMEKLRDQLASYIKDNNGKSSLKVQLKHNSTDGYYMTTTLIRGKFLEKYLKKKKIEEFDLDKHKLKVSDINFKHQKNSTKITIDLFKNRSKDVNKNIKKLTELVKKKYYAFLKDFSEDYTDDLKEISNSVTNIDYFCTIARTAKDLHYVRPNIVDKDHGYVNALQLRHPIVEHIIDHEYIPHNVELGDDLKGMLIYGLNSSGKSVLMKAIGLSVIMAQAGFYVPAKEFTYSPYNSLYTRITGNDNIFKGLSSFALEMVELNAILKRSGERTLVLGDEVCRGTEHISGNAIVATTLMHLSDTKSSFIFATHLHEIVNLDEIKERDNIKAFHLTVDYDSKLDALIYDRILKEGNGEKVYGVTVAKSIIHDAEFIENAVKIKNRLLDKHDGMLSDVTSNYNAQKVVFECEICGKRKKKEITNLETHHINFQKDFDKDGLHKVKSHIHKNAKYNLMVLCDKCHDKIHNGEISIESVKMTNRGKKVMVKKQNS
jgi:DNA mismatch repair protein MutS